MATQKIISANIQKQDCGTILNAGNVASSRWEDLSLIENNPATIHRDSHKVLQAGGTAGQSGNLGTYKPISAGIFGKANDEGNFISAYLCDTIAGVASTVLAGPANSRKIPMKWPGYQRLNITSWDYVTGVDTVGVNAGATVSPSGINGVVGQAADEAIAVPSFLVFQYGAANPSGSDYKTSSQS